MSYEADLHSHYAGVRSRLMAPPPKRIAVPIISEPVEPPADEREARAPTSGSVLREVAKKHNVTVMAIVGASRMARCIEPRREAATRMYVELEMSMLKIARRLNRDHTTILHMLRKYTKDNPDWRERYEALLSRRQAEHERLLSEVMRLHLVGLRPSEIAQQIGEDRSRVCSLIRTAATRYLLKVCKTEAARAS